MVTLVFATALALGIADHSRPPCDHIVDLNLERWRRDVRRATSPGLLDDLFSDLGLRRAPRVPGCEVKVSGVDRFAAALTDAAARDVVIQVRLRGRCERAEDTFTSLRVQVLTPFAKDQYCAKGDDLSVDVTDRERYCGGPRLPGQRCEASACSFVPVVDDDHLPRTFSFVQLTSGWRQTMLVIDARGGCAGCFCGAPAAATASLWDVRGGRLVQRLSVAYKDASTEGRARELSADHAAPFPLPVFVKGDDSCERYELKGETYQRAPACGSLQRPEPILPRDAP
jgi:hypothetical protein